MKLDYLSRIEAEATALADAAERDLAPPVQSCPGWTVADLVRHLGEIHRKVTERVRRRVTEESFFPVTLPDDSELVAWFRSGAFQLVSTLRGAGPESPAWNWSGPPYVTAFWHRRMAHETAVHRWDVTTEGDFGPGFASDAIDELMTVFLPSFAGRQPGLSLGGSLHVHCTDVPGEWLVELDRGRAEVRREHAKGDAVLRGPASDLLLVLYNRRPLDSVESMGSPEVLGSWTDNVRW